MTQQLVVGNFCADRSFSSDRTASRRFMSGKDTSGQFDDAPEQSHLHNETPPVTASVAEREAPTVPAFVASPELKRPSSKKENPGRPHSASPFGDPPSSACSLGTDGCGPVDATHHAVTKCAAAAPILDSNISETDVLCGRGGGTNNHIGNRYFRALVTQYRPKYVLAKKAEKNKIARAIVVAVRNSSPGGRFLKKDEIAGAWFDIGDKKATEKTSQALREGLASKMRQVLIASDTANAANIGGQSPGPYFQGQNGVAGNVHFMAPTSAPEKKKRKSEIPE